MAWILKPVFYKTFLLVLCTLSPFTFVAIFTLFTLFYWLAQIASVNRNPAQGVLQYRL